MASTLCKYNLFFNDLGKGATSEAGSISLELLMCSGGVHSILLLPPVTRCLETIDVCIWSMFVFMSVVVIVSWSMGMFVVLRPLLKYVVCLCKGSDGCCGFCLYCDA